MAKVVATVWRTEFIQFLAALAILHQDYLKNRMNSFFSSYHPGATHPFIHSIRVQNNKLCPSNSIDDLCLLFCINPSCMVILQNVFWWDMYRGFLLILLFPFQLVYLIRKSKDDLRFRHTNVTISKLSILSKCLFSRNSTHPCW